MGRGGNVKKKVPDWRVVQLARALRHLTLISRKQVTLTISRVCVVADLVAVLVSFSRILGDFRYRLCFSVLVALRL